MADQPEFLQRVEIAQLPVRFVYLVRWKNLKYLAFTRGRDWPLRDTQAEELAAFREVVQAYNISTGYSCNKMLEEISPAPSL